MKAKAKEIIICLLWTFTSMVPFMVSLFFMSDDDISPPIKIGFILGVFSMIWYHSCLYRATKQ